MINNQTIKLNNSIGDDKIISNHNNHNKHNIHNKKNDVRSNNMNENNDNDNDNDELKIDKYIESISPKRELLCPITQELFNDPVVAEDGYTYERLALQRWYYNETQKSTKNLRSPVTNSYLTGQSMFPNIAIKGMVYSHREYLGKELLNR